MERNIISIDEYGKVILPTDIQATAMSEWELCDLFNLTATTVKAGIKALCKNGILNECEIRHTVRLSDKCSIEVYSLETIIALAFRIGTYGRSRCAMPFLKDYTCEKRKQASSFR